CSRGGSGSNCRATTTNSPRAGSSGRPPAREPPRQALSRRASAAAESATVETTRSAAGSTAPNAHGAPTASATRVARATADGRTVPATVRIVRPVGLAGLPRQRLGLGRGQGRARHLRAGPPEQEALPEADRQLHQHPQLGFALDPLRDDRGADLVR